MYILIWLSIVTVKRLLITIYTADCTCTTGQGHHTTAPCTCYRAFTYTKLGPFAMCAISRAISYAKNSLWCSYVCTFPCVRYCARVISRKRFSRSMSEFLVRDFTRARCAYNAHARDLGLACQNKGWPAGSRKFYLCFFAEDKRFVWTKWN